MTNTVLLEKKIRESGLKIGYIAQTVGITRQTLWMKVKGKRAFNQYEIERLCSALGIRTMAERNEIFFAKEVDKNANIGA